MLLPQVSERLLAAHGLDQDILAQQLRQLMSHQIDFGDLYFQKGIHESWMLEDGIVKDGSYNIEQGVGVRAISGEKTGFAYSDELSLTALQQAVIAARGVANSGGDGAIKIWQPTQPVARYLALDPLPGLPQQHKITLLEELDKFARSLDPAVTQVMASLSGVYEEILIAATDGTLVADIRPLVRLSVTVLAERNGRRERGSSGGGGRCGYDYFFEIEQVKPAPVVMPVKRYVRHS
jgi:TldD protein